MRAPDSVQVHTRASIALRTVAWIAGAILMISTIAGPAAAAPATDPSSAPSDPQLIARQLASSAELGNGGSCDAGFSAVSQPGVFPGSGAFAARMMPAPPPAAGDLWVQCSLPFSQGKPGGDCEGKHTMQWSVVSGQATKVTAELFALDANGNPLASFIVQQGESVQMNSRLDPSDWKFKEGKGTYDIFAPVAMLKVTAEDANGDKAVAYCTSVPYADLVQPSGGVISESEGEAAIDFKAAVPRTDVADLQLLLDGVNVLPLIAAQQPLGLASCQYDSPCEGALLAPPLTYKNVIVDVASNVAVMASNTISGTFEGLDCGGHVVRVSTDPADDFRHTTPQCHLDDLTEVGSVSIFSVDVTDIGGLPVAPNLITSQVPTEVLGTICAGADIVSANVNGKALDVTGQLKVDKGFTPEGDHIGFKVTLDIDTELAQTDLRADLDGNTTQLGTFHQGSNRLVAVAMENSQGARAYDSHIFAVGNNIKPLGIDPAAVIVAPEALSAVVNAKVQSALQAKMDQVLNAPTSTDLDNAFVLGLSAEGAQTIINSLCVDPLPGDGRTLGQIFKATVEDVLDDFTLENPLTSFNFSPPCSCDTTVKVFIETVNADVDFACPLKFEDNKITATLELPDVTVRARAIGPENSCIFVYFFPPLFLPTPLPTHTEVDAFAEVKLHDITFSYTITEQDLLNKTTTVSTDPNDPPFKVGGKLELSAGGLNDGAGVEYGIAADICNFLLDGFVTVLTFGQVDIGPLLDLEINIHETIDLTEALRPAQPNALPLPDVRVKEQTVEPYHQKISGEISLVSDIHITGPTDPNASLSGAGITIGLKGSFATTKVDALGEENPGFEAFEADLPTMAQMQDQGAIDATVGLSSDAINALFYSLAGGGDMKVPGSDAQGCFLGANVGDVLPADCNTLDLPGVTGFGLEAVATIRGICHGIRRNDCDTLSMEDPDKTDPETGDLTAVLTGTIRGVCHGVKPDTAPVNDTPCLFVSPEADLVEIGTCFAAELLGVQTISPQSNVMFCAKGDIPVMSFPNNPAISGVTSDLALNDISVSLVVDRDGNGQVDGLINDLPGCFSGQQTSLDCNVVAACLDVNFRFAVQNTTCAADPTIPGDTSKPGFQFAFLDFLPIVRKVGEVCSGTTPPPSPDQQVLEASSDQDELTGPLAQNAGVLSPPICGAGLDMGGFVTCGNAQVLGLEADNETEFKEFLALTCDLQ